MSTKTLHDFKIKHPSDARPDEVIAAAVKSKAENGGISCINATAIASDQQLAMTDIGTTIDLLEIRIGKCQLGLFGYGEGKKLISFAKELKPELEKAIAGRLINNRLPCAAAWEIAALFGIAKMDVASACETLGIKIKPCQLGAFLNNACMTVWAESFCARPIKVARCQAPHVRPKKNNQCFRAEKCIFTQPLTRHYSRQIRAMVHVSNTAENQNATGPVKLKAKSAGRKNQQKGQAYDSRKCSRGCLQKVLSLPAFPCINPPCHTFVSCQILYRWFSTSI